MEQALKPCPFCGGSEVRCCNTGLFWVSCDSCGAEGPTSITSEEEAVEEWNRRTPAAIEAAKDVRTEHTPTAIEASPVVGEIEAVAWENGYFEFRAGGGGQDDAVEAFEAGFNYALANRVDKADAWDAIAEKNARIASLQSENQALREEIERWAAVANREDECRKDWQSRAEAAEAQVVGAWNAFGQPGPAWVETAAEVYEMFAQADGDIPEQIRELERQLTAAESQVQSLTLKLEERDKALEPFAKLADEVDALGHEDDSTCVWRLKASDLRRARAPQSGGAEHA